MRLAFIVSLLPLAATAEPDSSALFQTLITGTWAETRAACTTDRTWDFGDGSVIIHGDGGESCGFLQPDRDDRGRLALDLLCPIPGERMQASTRRIKLDLRSVSPDRRNRDDRLTVTDLGQALTLLRCD